MPTRFIKEKWEKYSTERFEAKYTDLRVDNKKEALLAADQSHKAFSKFWKLHRCELIDTIPILWLIMVKLIKYIEVL